MIPSVSMWSFNALITGGMTTEDFLSWASRNALSDVELLSYYADRTGAPDRTAEILKKLSLGVSCYTILNDFTSSAEYSHNDLINDLDTAVILQAPYVRVLTGDNRDCEYRKIIEGLSMAVSEAEKRGLKLVLENIGPYSGSSDGILEIIHAVDSPLLRINFDTANPLLSDENPAAALKKLLPYVEYVHLKDFITEGTTLYEEVNLFDRRVQTSSSGRTFTGIAAGSGDAGIREVLGILKEADYSGFVSVEYENDYKPEKSVEESLSLLAEYC